MNEFTTCQKDFLARPIFANISIIHAKFRLPIVFPAWVLEYENKLYLTTAVQAHKVKYIEKDNRIGLNIVDPKGYPYLAISGTASFIHKADSARFDLLRNKIVDKYDVSGDYRARTAKDPNPIERIMIEIVPMKIFGGVK